MKKQLLSLFIFSLLDQLLANSFPVTGQFLGPGLMPHLCLIVLLLQVGRFEHWLTVFLYAFLIGELSMMLYGIGYALVIYPLFALVLYGFGQFVRYVWFQACLIWLLVSGLDFVLFWLYGGPSLGLGRWFLYLGLPNMALSAFVLILLTLWDHPLPKFIRARL